MSSTGSRERAGKRRGKATLCRNAGPCGRQAVCRNTDPPHQLGADRRHDHESSQASHQVQEEGSPEKQSGWRSRALPAESYRS